MITVLLASFLVAHGLIHASYLMPTPQPAGSWPFAIGDSWLVRRLGVAIDGLRAAVVALVLATIVAFAMAALASLGVVPATWFAPMAISGAVASLVLLAAMFKPWIVLGFVIDAALLWLVVGQGWSPERLG